MATQCMAKDGKVKCSREGCPERFTPKKSWQKFHSSQCRDQHHTAARKAAVELRRAQKAS